MTFTSNALRCTLTFAFVPDSLLISICCQTSVTIEIRYQSMDGSVGVWSDGEFLDVPEDRDGMFAFETESLLSGQSRGSGTSPGRSLQGSIPTFRK